MLPVCMYIVYPEDGAFSFVLICQVSLCLYPGDCSLNFAKFLKNGLQTVWDIPIIVSDSV